MKIAGVIESGLGKGAFFTSLDWVVDQFERAMGFKPFPGTLNVRVIEPDLPLLASFFAEKDFELVPDNAAFCTASLKKVRVNGAPAAAVFPSEDVRAHGRNVIELMSEKHLKDALGLEDGDLVTITEFYEQVIWGGRRIEAIVFDVDGTLTDSIEAYYETFRKACAMFGIRVNRKDVLEAMAVGANIWDSTIPPDLPGRRKKIEQCIRVIEEVFPDSIRDAKPFSGVEEILLRLRQSGLKLGIVTGSLRWALLPLEQNGLIDYFEAVITREDGYTVKPAPDGLLACLKLMNVDPGRAVTVGDSALDIRAGKEAGTLTVGVLSGIASRKQLEAEDPASIIDGVEGLTSLLGLDSGI